MRRETLQNVQNRAHFPDKLNKETCVCVNLADSTSARETRSCMRPMFAFWQHFYLEEFRCLCENTLTVLLYRLRE